MRLVAVMCPSNICTIFLTLLAPLYILLFLLAPSPADASPMTAFGVNIIPLLDNTLPPWIHPDHAKYFGPLGAYLQTLLQGCGFSDGFYFRNWTNSSRIAEYDVLTTDAQIGFPIARVWTTSATTLSREAGGAYFLPVIESPGEEYIYIYNHTTIHTYIHLISAIILFSLRNFRFL